MSGTIAHGREGDRDAVIHQPGQLVLVSGDSGIGKSTLLARLYEAADSSELAAHPVALRALGGSLQRSMAESLGEILHRTASEQPVFSRSVWAAMKDVVARASSVTGRQVGELVIGRAFDYVEGKLGKDLTKVIRATLEEALQPVDVGLESQLTRLSTPDVAEQVAALAGAVATHSGRRLLLLYDVGERLSTEDQALLLEMSRTLPENVRVVVAVNSYDPNGAALIRQLGLNDVVAHELLPLDHQAVSSWLDSEEVAPGQRQAIDRLSNGYPLFIAEALHLIREGATLDDLKTPPRFELLFDISWQRLDANEQLLVARLAGFGEPPPDDFLADYLGLSALQLSIVQRRLVNQGIFIRRPGGPLWFHERRRQHIWGTILTDRDREEVAADAYDAISTWIRSRDRLDSWVTSSTPFVARALSASGTSDYVANLLGITLHQLSILWAALEICEPGEGPGLFADTDEVVRYAGVRSGCASGNAVEAVRHLTDLGLVVVATNDYASVFGLVIPSLMDYAALLGEIELRFRTRPIPRLASTAFDALIRPMLGKFEAAVISVGQGSLTAFKAHYIRLTANNNRAPFQPPPALALALKVDGHSLGVTTTFDGTDDLSDALERLSSLDVDSARVKVVESHLLPPSRVQYGRYERLIRRFDQQWRPRAVSGVGDLVAALDERAAVQAAFIANLDAKDASALGFRHSHRYLLEVAGDGTAWTEFEVAGAATTTTGIVPGPDAPPLMRDPLRELRLRSSGLIAAGERLRRWTTHFGQKWEVDHPVRHLFDAFCDQGRAFNRNLPRVKLVLDADLLAEEIKREQGTRNRLVQVLEGQGSPLVEGSANDSIFLSLYPFAFHGGYAWGATTLRVSNGASDVRVRVLYDGPPATEGRRLTNRGAFDVEESLVRGWGDGYASSVLSDLLGYVEEDIQLVDPRSRVTANQ